MSFPKLAWEYLHEQIPSPTILPGAKGILIAGAGDAGKDAAYGCQRADAVLALFPLLARSLNDINAAELFP